MNKSALSRVSFDNGPKVKLIPFIKSTSSTLYSVLLVRFGNFPPFICDFSPSSLSRYDSQSRDFCVRLWVRRIIP